MQKACPNQPSGEGTIFAVASSCYHSETAKGVTDPPVFGGAGAAFAILDSLIDDPYCRATYSRFIDFCRGRKFP